jgi:hypothetical protein
MPGSGIGRTFSFLTLLFERCSVPRVLLARDCA